MLLSPPNDLLFFLPQTKPKTLIGTKTFFIFPKPSSNILRFSPTPLQCLHSSTTTGDTEILPQSAIQRIAQKLRSLGYVEEDEKESDDNTLICKRGQSPGEIFVPLPTQLPKYRVGHSLDPSWSTPENPVPEPGSGNGIQRFHELKSVVKKERIEDKSKRRELAPTLAELTLSRQELRRLRTIGIALDKKLKVGKAGITEGIVNGIHERWRRNEVVKIVCEDICRMNMKRTHELLERKTGGLVVWRAGSKILLYRGVDYKYPYFVADDDIVNDTANEAAIAQLVDYGALGESDASSYDNIDGASNMLSSARKVSRPALIQGVGTPNRVRFQLPGEVQIVQEADSMLEGLGPRFTDWWGYEPLPVDADLLPAVVPGYRRPFRMLPYGVKPKLTNDEMTILKRLGRPLPCHFALGRSRKLQGLASAILKLWEKCEIAKVAIKRGDQNTSSKMMAEELKSLTGGTLLSRDKEFIVLYRGKDFLPAAVSSAIEDQRKHRLISKQSRTTPSSDVLHANRKEQSVSEDPLECEKTGRNGLNLDHDVEQRRLRSGEAAIERTSVRLAEALAKKERAEKLLADLERQVVSEPEIDKEGITEEERYMLRRVGLRMRPFLLMGRRGVFAGTIENMHLHWKYRELVKIIFDSRSINEVHGVARTLEAESGGILVAVERASKGYAIIVYRGKNYKRPASLRPQTLLNKREAMKRSLEAQRHKSLQLHVLKLTQNIEDLKLQLDNNKGTSNKLLPEQTRPELVKELEMDTVQSAENKMLGTTLEALPEGTLSTSSSEQDSLRDNYSHESQSFPKSPTKESEAMPNMNDRDRRKNTLFSGSVEVSSQIRSLDLKDTLPRILDSRTAEVAGSRKTERRSSDRVSGDKRQTLPSGVSHLSNKERLLLRKQALMTRKRPLFAIGKSNVVAGVAKALKAHFQKHPLAIVHVKGRAKGTSVQEVVIQLQEATGAILVSDEPSKVILYRGWGAGEEVTAPRYGKSSRSTSYTENIENQTRYIASPELLSAIRLECGLQLSQQKTSTS